MKCPVCKLATGIYEELVITGDIRWLPHPLYQRSYKGEPEYISQRCLKCYEKAEKKLLRRLVSD